MPAVEMPLRPKLTEEEYLRLEREADIKHEFVEGVMYAMSGVRDAHEALTRNLHGLVWSAFRKRSCRNFGSDMKVRVDYLKRYYYPDFSALCGKPEFFDSTRDVLTNPQLIIEVLSKSTERIDRTEKFSAYRLIPSFEEYALIAQWEPKVEVFRRQTRDEWNVEEIEGSGGKFDLKSVGVTISMAELYEDVELTPRDEEYR